MTEHERMGARLKMHRRSPFGRLAATAHSPHNLHGISTPFPSDLHLRLLALVLKGSGASSVCLDSGGRVAPKLSPSRG